MKTWSGSPSKGCERPIAENGPRSRRVVRAPGLVRSSAKESSPRLGGPAHSHLQITVPAQAVMRRARLSAPDSFRGPSSPVRPPLLRTTIAANLAAGGKAARPWDSERSAFRHFGSICLKRETTSLLPMSRPKVDFFPGRLLEWRGSRGSSAKLTSTPATPALLCERPQGGNHPVLDLYDAEGPASCAGCRDEMGKGSGPRDRTRLTSPIEWIGRLRSACDRGQETRVARSIYYPGKQEGHLRARRASEWIPAGMSHSLAGAAGSYDFLSCRGNIPGQIDCLRWVGDMT